MILFLVMFRGPVEGSLGILHVSTLFGVSGDTASYLFKHTVCAVRRSPKQIGPPLIAWYGPAKRKAMRGLISGFPVAIGFVDGTKERTFRPGDPISYELRCDGHHHFHAHSVLAWCDVFGDFMRLDISLHGVDHDQMMFNTLRNVYNLQRIYPAMSV
jgi:hypothetical protein